MTITYKEGSKDFIDNIKPLWEALAKHHQEKSLHFGSFFDHFNFEMRKPYFEKSENLKIIIAYKDEEAIGYIVSSVTGKKAEIESLYIKNDYRGLKIGDEFMSRSLNWIETFDVNKTILGVSVGNDDVFSFYEKYGFYPRTSILERK